MNNIILFNGDGNIVTFEDSYLYIIKKYTVYKTINDTGQ